ncbi:MAG: aminopeptidase [Mycoplasmataceae bacterium]|nr:aminopeptidase [Mycoplasmataceae bacterium]
MDYTKKLEDYAKVIVNVGANVKKDQIVVISSIIEAYPLTRLVVEQCYKKGAKKVIVNWNDGAINKLDYMNQSLETLTTVAQYDIDRAIVPVVKEGGCRIVIGGNSPAALNGVDPKKIGAVVKKMGTCLKELRDWTMASKCQWTIAYYPSVEWAKMVFPKLKEEEAVNKLMDAILKTVRVDGKKDPIALWKAHNQETSEWAKKLNKFNFDYLEFKNKAGTNVKIQLVKNHIWGSGEHASKDKVVPNFTANLPTEEVWTMPDMNGINGHVVATKPLSYSGNIIDGFSFDFKDGEVVGYKAKKGKEVLAEIFATEGAKKCGEIALVPKTSPINKSNILFYATLFDENAACHIALGASYPSNLKGGVEMTKEELLAHHANVSLVHIDFMFGSDDMNVVGYKKGKEPVQVMKNGLLVI